MQMSKYFSNVISQNYHCPKLLFSTVNYVLNPPSGIGVGHTTRVVWEVLLFLHKIACIKSQIVMNTSQKVWYLPLGPGKFSHFHPISDCCLSELLSIVSSLRLTTCSLEVIPTMLLMKVLDAVAPNIIYVINISLQTGSVISCLKHVVVHPLLKKAILYPSDFNNYRPILKLPFLSKVLVKAVLNQLSPYLIENNILDPFQCGFRSKHITESALLRELNNFYFYTYYICGYSFIFVDAVLVLLGLNVVFDTVYHCIL